MKRRLSLPLLRSISLLGYAAMVVLSIIATARDFHLTSFAGGVFLTIAAYDAHHFFLSFSTHPRTTS